MNFKIIYLSTTVELVGELDFGETDGLLHPVGPKVGGVGVDVHAAGGGGLRLTARHPFSIHIPGGAVG